MMTLLNYIRAMILIQNPFDNDFIPLFQLKEGLSSLGQAEQLLARCPSCYENFKRSICEFTCNPKNSEYLNPTVIPDNGKLVKL